MAGTDRAGRTPLQYAAGANDADTVSKLLTKGANPNVADRPGFTPCISRHREKAIAAAGALLAAGADVDAANSYGNTPLWTAVFNRLRPG